MPDQRCFFGKLHATLDKFVNRILSVRLSLDVRQRRMVYVRWRDELASLVFNPHHDRVLSASINHRVFTSTPVINGIFSTAVKFRTFFRRIRREYVTERSMSRIARLHLIRQKTFRSNCDSQES
jgi:hypothetical protein